MAVVILVRDFPPRAALFASAGLRVWAALRPAPIHGTMGNPKCCRYLGSVSINRTKGQIVPVSNRFCPSVSDLPLGRDWKLQFTVFLTTFCVSASGTHRSHISWPAMAAGISPIRPINAQKVLKPSALPFARCVGELWDGGIIGKCSDPDNGRCLTHSGRIGQ